MRTLLLLAAFSASAGFYALLHYWLGRRLISPIRSAQGWQRWAWGAIAFAMLLGLAGLTVGRITPRTPLVNVVQWTGLIAMGWMTITVGLVVIRDILWGVFSLIERFLRTAQAEADPESQAELESRRRFLRGASSLAVIGASGVMAGNGVRSARETAALRYVDIPISGLDPALDGMTILQLSDVHVGDTIRRAYFQRIVDRSMTVGADLIVITGDLVDGTVDQLRDDVQPITALNAPLGVHFITGNHEYYSGPLEWIEHLRDLGVRVLLDEHVVLEHQGAPFVLAGVTDYTAPRMVQGHVSDPRKAFEGAPEDVLRILLAHQPRDYAAAKDLGVHLQLSGHTHGGQIWPFGILVPLQQRFVAGLHRVWGSMWLYISRGTGYWGPPMRVGAPSEITVLTLRRRA